MINANKSPKITYSTMVREIRNPYPGPDHHQKLNISRGSPVAPAYHVWSRLCVVLLTERQTDRTTDHILRQPWRSNY